MDLSKGHSTTVMKECSCSRLDSLYNPWGNGPENGIRGQIPDNVPGRLSVCLSVCLSMLNVLRHSGESNFPSFFRDATPE